MYNTDMKKAVFLDRDGVINELIFYAEQGVIDIPMNPSQIKLIHGISELLKYAKESDFIIVVCSNQSGVGLGKVTLENLNRITEEINSKLKSKGVTIDNFYYCMHHPYAKLRNFKAKCKCRKPEIGLFLKAEKELDIDLSKSWMVGDGIDDVKAGQKAGCRTILLANIKSTENLRIIEEQLGPVKPDFIVKKLPQVLEIIKRFK